MVALRLICLTVRSKGVKMEFKAAVGKSFESDLRDGNVEEESSNEWFESGFLKVMAKRRQARNALQLVDFPLAAETKLSARQDRRHGDWGQTSLPAPFDPGFRDYFNKGLVPAWRWKIAGACPSSFICP